MRKTAFFLVLITIIFVSESRAASPYDSVNVEPFGKVFIYKQTATPEHVAIMISGDGGWKYGVTGFAETFSEMNTLVIGVDILRYFRDLRKRTGDCYDIAADFVKLAAEIEKTYKYTDYTPPVIMGYSSGASLVYGILAQARPETFMGGISLGFCPDIELPKILCQINGLTEKVFVPGKSFYLQPDARLGNKWIVLQGMLDKVCNYSAVEEFVKKTTDAELISLPKVGHGFSKWSDFMPQWKDAYNRIIKESVTKEDMDVTIDSLKGIPVKLTEAKIQNKDFPVALLISGDGGWYGFEQSIADNLSRLGIPTVGLDSRKYFWNRRSVDETAADMEKLLRFYSRKWGRDSILLIGYSLGAEIVPFVVNRLPEDIKSKITSAVLLSPGLTTDFEIHISNMLGMGNRQNTYNVVDEINKMQSVKTLVIFGIGEKSEVPALLHGKLLNVREIPGDHHYKSDLDLIIKTMNDNNAF